MRKNKIIGIMLILLCFITLLIIPNAIATADQKNNDIEYMFFMGTIHIDCNTGSINYLKLVDYYILNWDASDMYIRIIGYMVKPRVGLVGVDNLVWDNSYSKITGFILFEGLLIEGDDGFKLDGSFLYSRISVI